MTAPFIIAVLDCETTGTDPAVDRVVEVGVAHVDPAASVIVGSVSALYHPGARGIPPEASAVHHLTLADLEGRPEYSPDLGPDGLTHSWGDARAAHNAKFDRAFLTPANEPPWLCTLKLARVAYPDAPAYGNQVLRYYLGLEPKLPPGLAPHRAEYDALVTAELLLRLWAHFSGDLPRMLEISQRPSLLRRVGFGQHADKLWSEVPRDYLRWLLDDYARKGGWDEDRVYTARHYYDGGGRR